MKGLLYFCLLFCTACAGLINAPTTRVKLITDRPTSLVHQGDTLFMPKGKVNIRAERQAAPLQLYILQQDTIRRLLVPPRNAPAYWANILYNGGTGLWVERNNPRRYTYPSRIYVNWDDPEQAFTRYDPWSRQGQWQLQLSMPHMNQFLFRPSGEPNAKSSLGFWGLSLGLGYYVAPQQYVQLSASAVTDILVPVPASIDYSGEHEFLGSAYLAMSHHMRQRRWVWGYGLSVSRNRWELRYFDRFAPLPPTRAPVLVRDHAVGMVFSTYYACSPQFHLGLIYRPSFWRFAAPKPWQYEQVISLDLAWQLPL